MKIQTQLILWHRYLGIATCLLFASWFISGIVMMYAEMPSLTPEERSAALPTLDTGRIKLSPRDAVARAEMGTAPVQSIVLSSLFGRPVYRFRVQGGLVTVFADDGRVASEFDAEEVLQSIRPYMPPTPVPWRLVEVQTEPDQWTLEGSFEALRPLYKVAVDDRQGTVLYVSGVTGDVVLKTTSRSRALAWAGAIPHWLYITALRKHAEFWRQLVIWIAGVCCITSIFGIAVGVSRFSFSKRRRSPYEGTKLWHHWSGIVFGAIAFTWAFSGMLSLDPGPFQSGSRPTGKQIRSFTGGPLDPSAFDLSVVKATQAKEIGFLQVGGSPFYTVSGHWARAVFLDGEGAVAPPFPEAFLLEAARRAVPDGGIVEATRLTGYDAYYYDREWRRPLPVLRVKFDDRARTWLYIDPARGALVSRFDRWLRFDRWIYHGLHSLDFPFLWPYRPWWDVVVILLLGGGLAISVTGAVMGFDRIRRFQLGTSRVGR
jgi:hypothetical protein